MIKMHSRTRCGTESRTNGGAMNAPDFCFVLLLCCVVLFLAYEDEMSGRSWWRRDAATCCCVNWTCSKSSLNLSWHSAWWFWFVVWGLQPSDALQRRLDQEERLKLNEGWENEWKSLCRCFMAKSCLNLPWHSACGFVDCSWVTPVQKKNWTTTEGWSWVKFE